MIPLFEHHPLLKDNLPHVPLGQYPTPVEKLERMGRAIGVNHLYIKRDDLSGEVYGGNKIRKLEFILGHALRVKARGVFAFGFAGSNHAVAMAIYAKQVGLKSISMLMPQPNAHYVRNNLLLSHHYGAELHQYPHLRRLYLGTFCQFMRHKLKNGYFPLYVSPGGSSPLGITGYVNAAFELKEQIMKGKMPEPDCIYVALGTMGTATGLTLGVKAANLRSRVVSVRVTPKRFASETKMVKLLRKTNSFLNSKDPSFPQLEFSKEEIDMRHGFLGQGYAHFTVEGMEAIARMEKNEGIKLDGTYTGKTLAALVNDAKKQDLEDKVVLFWNTYNSRDLTDITSKIDYRQLPRGFHPYFEEEVQPLDRKLNQ